MPSLPLWMNNNIDRFPQGTCFFLIDDSLVIHLDNYLNVIDSDAALLYTEDDMEVRA